MGYLDVVNVVLLAGLGIVIAWFVIGYLRLRKIEEFKFPPNADFIINYYALENITVCIFL